MFGFTRRLKSAGLFLSLCSALGASPMSWATDDASANLPGSAAPPVAPTPPIADVSSADATAIHPPNAGNVPKNDPDGTASTTPPAPAPPEAQASPAQQPRAPSADTNAGAPAAVSQSSSEPKYVYKPSLWSCRCANFPKKRCDNGYAFSSISSAVQYSKQACGSDCTPDCSSKSASPDDADGAKKANDSP
jgi:hypothetical protein